jgi:hypothetical protein
MILAKRNILHLSASTREDFPSPASPVLACLPQQPTMEQAQELSLRQETVTLDWRHLYHVSTFLSGLCTQMMPPFIEGALVFGAQLDSLRVAFESGERTSGESAITRVCDVYTEERMFFRCYLYYDERVLFIFL